MTDITPYDYIPADVAPAEPARPRLLVLATSLVSVAVGMGFLGLIGYYLSWRADVISTGERWLPTGVDIPLTQPNFMGVTLAFSVITIWWSVAAIRDDDRSNAFVAFLISIVFGVAFLAQTAYLFTIMQMEILADERSALIYGIIGTHMVLTIVAMGFALVMALRTLGGGYSARDYEGVLSSALFWTMIVALYGVQWYAIYITK
ncbi:MAG: cytochrome c oxidase subunit 3 [Acidimicrobiia bacterium]|nr:cytochrome c oxidase subunit 3 [Acidimicrobiia bacterium]